MPPASRARHWPRGHRWPLEAAERHVALARAYAVYQRLLVAAGCIDFGDQVGLAVRLLEDHPEVRRVLRERYRFVLVDEFQDTDPAQLRLLQALVGPRGNLTVVGDDDQAIYGFRGAVDGAAGAARRAWPTATTITLRRNYRSRRPILAAAARLIACNDPSDPADPADARPPAARRPSAGAATPRHVRGLRDRGGGSGLGRGNPCRPGDCGPAVAQRWPSSCAATATRCPSSRRSTGRGWRRGPPAAAACSGGRNAVSCWHSCVRPPTPPRPLTCTPSPRPSPTTSAGRTSRRCSRWPAGGTVRSGRSCAN